MNLLKSPLRRTTAVLAGAFIGLAGAVALAGPASAHSPTVGGTATCVKDGSWTIDWSIGNDYNTDATVKKIEVDHDLKITGPITVDGAIVPANSDKDATKQVHGTTADVPGDVSSVTAKVYLYWPQDDYSTWKPAEYTVNKPGECKPETPPTKPETPPTKPSTPAQPGEPKPIFEEDCTTMTIGLDNPKDGIEITLKFKTSKGEERTDVIKPGEAKSEKFSATKGFTVTVTLTTKEYGTDTETVPYEQPEGCDNAGGGGLPVTGAAAGGIAGGAALLLIAGGGLVLMARRRKVKFTA